MYVLWHSWVSGSVKDNRLPRYQKCSAWLTQSDQKKSKGLEFTKRILMIAVQECWEKRLRIHVRRTDSTYLKNYFMANVACMKAHETLIHYT